MLFSSLLLISGLHVCFGHSMMSVPQSTAPWTCTLGGEAELGVPIDNCSGPCDLRAMELGWANHGDPSNPAASYKRGQEITVKYTRNNHRAGGFIRLAFVKVQDMMNAKAHERAAFHYSCFGANVRLAKGKELLQDKYGFNTTGNDGEEHKLPVAYYYVDVIVPSVLPDGDYVLGWVWFGGTFGYVRKNAPERPTPWGYWSDYWSCSYVRIKGGEALTSSYMPKFVNDMSQFSTSGCRAANDRPGICPVEPCKTEDGKYQAPYGFKGGQKKNALTVSMFR